MSATTTKTRGLSKKATRADAGKIPHACGWFQSVIDDLGPFFRRNLAVEISSRAGRSVSVAERWISGKGAPDGEALATLLNSDIGDRVWLAMTRSSLHPWRKRLKRQIEISELRDQQRETARRLEALERGEA